MTRITFAVSSVYIATSIIISLFFALDTHAQVVTGFQKISSTEGGFSGETSALGYAVANIGDLDGDGIVDAMVSDRTQNEGLWILFLNEDGSVKKQRRIQNKEALAWGTSMALIGDLDGDGAPEIAVGAPGDFFSGDRGEVWVLSMNPNGSVKHRFKLDGFDFQMSGMGVSLAGLGDIDGDGIPDLAAGGIDPTNNGAVITLRFNADGTVKAYERFSLDENPSGGETGYQQFGRSMASIGDLDGDGVTDLIVGKPLDNDGGAADDRARTCARCSTRVAGSSAAPTAPLRRWG